MTPPTKKTEDAGLDDSAMIALKRMIPKIQAELFPKIRNGQGYVVDEDSTFRFVSVLNPIIYVLNKRFGSQKKYHEHRAMIAKVLRDSAVVMEEGIDHPAYGPMLAKMMDVPSEDDERLPSLTFKCNAAGAYALVPSPLMMHELARCVNVSPDKSSYDFFDEMLKFLFDKYELVDAISRVHAATSVDILQMIFLQFSRVNLNHIRQEIRSYRGDLDTTMTKPLAKVNDEGMLGLIETISVMVNLNSANPRRGITEKLIAGSAYSFFRAVRDEIQRDHENFVNSLKLKELGPEKERQVHSIVNSVKAAIANDKPGRVVDNMIKLCHALTEVHYGDGPTDLLVELFITTLKKGRKVAAMTEMLGYGPVLLMPDAVMDEILDDTMTTNLIPLMQKINAKFPVLNKIENDIRANVLGPLIGQTKDNTVGFVEGGAILNLLSVGSLRSGSFAMDELFRHGRRVGEEDVSMDSDDELRSP